MRAFRAQIRRRSVAPTRGCAGVPPTTAPSPWLSARFRWVRRHVQHRDKNAIAPAVLILGREPSVRGRLRAAVACFRQRIAGESSPAPQQRLVADIDDVVVPCKHRATEGGGTRNEHDGARNLIEDSLESYSRSKPASASSLLEAGGRDGSHGLPWSSSESARNACLDGELLCPRIRRRVSSAWRDSASDMRPISS